MFRNKHFNAMLTKFLLVITVLGLLLPLIGNLTTITAVIAAVILTLIGYLVADLIVLSLFGNRMAVLVDGILTVLVVWEAAWIIEGVKVTTIGLVLVVLLIGLGEWYYHNRYLSRLLFRGRIKP
ncbi:MAG: hypothetical protein A4E53_02239 [Pelotomaculum sp. PtaB.Bin104]|nr:MAG: hypothetical protein A4E53_02239 [Pelotomaculum sp. PtaB.Bin104]